MAACFMTRVFREVLLTKVLLVFEVFTAKIDFFR